MRTVDVETYTLEIDPDPQLVPTARMFAATVTRQLGCAEDSVLDIKIAISEACTNAVQAHRAHGVDTPVKVSIEEDGPRLVYEIRDAGHGIDVTPDSPPEVFRRAVEEDPEAAQGMGLALIRAIFPTTEFDPVNGGTVVRFRLER